MELMQASHQWASRPADQRFLSLTDLAAHCDKARDSAVSKTLSTRAIEAHPVEADHKALLVVGPNGVPVAPTNWAFGQLAQRAGAPAGYMQKLPAPLAADCINYGLRYNRDIEEIGTLVRDSGDGSVLAAVTGPNYGRIWDSTIAHALIRRFGDGISGDFRVPGEFGKAVAVTKANTTLYASDRDMFVFLADEKNRIEVPNRRNGQSGQMARGFFVWNSEVGAKTFGVATFLFDYVCMNRIVWGATEFSEIKLRHTSSAPDRWIEEVAPAIEAYAHGSTNGIVQAITAAKEKRIDNIDDFLLKRFTKTQASAIKAVHMQEEQRPIETLWDVATGATAYARGVTYQEDRVELERKAGKIIDLAA